MGSVDEIQVTGKGESMSFVVKTVGALVLGACFGKNWTYHCFDMAAQSCHESVALIASSNIVYSVQDLNQLQQIIYISN